MWILAFLAIRLVLALLCTSIVTATSDIPNPETTETPGRLCTTEKCQQAGNALIENLNVTIEPCNNFYEHACGGWIAKNPLQESKLVLDYEDLLETKIRQQLKDLLEKSGELDTGAVKKAKDFYQSCVNEDAINTRGIAPVVSMVTANGGWPLTLQSEHWTNSFTLQKILENYVKLGAFWPLLRIGIAPDARITEQKILMTQLVIPPSQSWLYFRLKSKDSKITTYKSYAKAVIQEYVKSGEFNVSSADLDKDIDDMVAFESELWTAIASSTGPRNVETTIADLQNKWNSMVTDHPELTINWLEVIRGSFSETNIAIDETEKILMYPKDNVAAIASLLNRTPVRTILNYVHWYVIYDALTFTNVQQRILSNSEVNQRPNSCFIQRELAHAYSYIYVRNNVDSDILNTANGIVSQIQSEFKREFDRSTFLNDGEKLVGNNTVDRIRNNVGYPGWYDEAGKIDEYYQKLTIGSFYYENVLNIRRFYEIKSAQTLRQPNAEQEIPSITAHLKFNTKFTSLALPAGLLQLPLFHPEIPLSMNYGTIGVLTGQEIASAFLYGGVIENNEQTPWFSSSTITKYNEKNKCFVDQYNKYPLTEYKGTTIKINGEGTLQLHVADNTGIKLALKAYLSRKKVENLEEVKIPSLNAYSDEQLFFYSVANLFCAAYEPNHVANQVSTVSRVRVNGALSNLNEFTTAFKCPSGSPMNPETKCALFD